MSCGRSPQQDQPPLSLNPQNPHYFLFRDKPTVLIGSTEHYGAVLNLDFDYVTYLDEVAASGLNVTRTFSGVYLEPGGAFGILRNTLAPAPERYICPWARSSEPGYTNGGNKFDLMQWDPAYFTRLKDFITQAGKRGIIVELDLFSNFYDTVQWKLSPLYIANNVNSIGNIVDQKEILSLRHPEVLGIQEKMVRKIVSELKDFDNLYYEVCNEPYFGDTIALREWEKHMTGIVADAEEGFTAKHLISNNIANGQQLVSDRSESISIYNFHYAKPPVTVAMNYHHNRVIGDNETGFNGIEDATYRTEAWDFMMAGGGLFNHLDYSFTTDNEDGSNIIEEGQPGGGGKTLRNQFKILATFMKGIDFINMVPVTTDMMRLSEAGNTSFYGLAKPEELYAIYLHCRDTTVTKTVIEINLLTGSYDLTWLDTKTAEVRTEAIENHPGGWVKISSPEYLTDIALKIAMVK
jgi:hypothetical protein